MSHQFQQHFPIHTVKGFFKIYEIHIDRRVPFDGLFDNDPKGGNLVSTGSVVPEASLVFPQFLIPPSGASGAGCG